MKRTAFSDLNRAAIRRDSIIDARGFAARLALCTAGAALFVALISLDPMGAMVERDIAATEQN